MLLTGIKVCAATHGVSAQHNNTLRDHMRCRTTWGKKHCSKLGLQCWYHPSSITLTLKFSWLIAFKRCVREPGSISQDCNWGIGRGRHCACENQRSCGSYRLGNWNGKSTKSTPKDNNCRNTKNLKAQIIGQAAYRCRNEFF